ncbi:MAG TPA: F0F1 ATP synthase subunit gamma [Stellaceae bacterium]|nr:F0F1 ATP synthase subunit gamma [Stellaceae bacterium]
MRLAEIEAHIGNIAELLDIVGAMRSLAGMRLQEAQRALPGIRRYTETVAGAIGDALLLGEEATSQPQRRIGRQGVVLCTAEHGFVGGFNERILDAAEAAISTADALFVLGTRGAALAQEHGRRIAWSHPMAARPEGVAEVVRRLSVQIFTSVVADRLESVDIIYPSHRQGGDGVIQQQRLFPIDPTHFAAPARRTPPLHNLPAGVLLERLVANYVSALLAEAAIESLASENAARFAAMEAAHDNVAKKLERLQQDARQARQGEITEELLDLVSGASAVRRSAI